MSEEPSSDEGRSDIPVQDEIEMIFEEAADYVEFPASATRGGRTRRDDFRMTFFTEYLSEPHGQRYEINDEGNIGALADLGEYDLIRKKQATAVMTPNNAFTVAIWIIANLYNVPEEEVEQFVIDRFRG